MRGRPALLVVLACAAVFATALLVHLPTLQHEFLLSWDDPDYVTKNPWIRGWSSENLVHVFTHPHFGNYFPLHLVSYMVDYGLWGLDPFGFHLHSVLLDAANAALALVVVWQLLGSLPVALVAALLFAVHPSHVEAVAWVSIRKDLLSTTFLLLAVALYLRATREGALRPAAYAASVACFTLGLLSKVTIVLLPLFLLVVDRLPGARRERPGWAAALVRMVPFVAVGALLALVNAVVLAEVKPEGQYADDPVRYVLVRGDAVWTYLGLLTGLPRGRPIYDTPVLAIDPLTVTVGLAGLAVLPAAVGIALRRGNRALATGAAWVTTLLAPAVAFPLLTWVADRYLYAPSLGFCWVLGAGIVAAATRLAGGRGRGVAVAALAVVPFALFAARTVEYDAVWKSSETLWTYGTERSRDYRALNNLAQVRIGQRRFDEAERLLKLAAQIDNVVSFQSLGTIYFQAGRYAEAEAAIDRALAIAAAKRTEPAVVADLQFTRGGLYWARSDPEKARQAWEAALRANPAHAGARQWLRVARGETAPPPF